MEQMSEEMSHVKTAQITYAVRNTSIDGMEIAEGDIMRSATAACWQLARISRRPRWSHFVRW